MKKPANIVLNISYHPLLVGTVKKLLNISYHPLLIRFAIYQFQKQCKKLNSIEDFVNFAFNFKVGIPLKGLTISIKPVQIKEEIFELLKILKKTRPKNIIEIGTAGGGTLFLFCQVAHPKAKIISIDLPGGKFGEGYPLWRIPLYKSFAKPLQKIYFIRDDSHKLATLEKVKSILNGQKLDFLFIDGDHTYKGVKKDFEMYGKLVEKEGIIALHDIVYHPFVPECQVERFWKKIKNKYKTKEIVKDWNQGECGIGVILW